MTKDLSLFNLKNQISNLEEFQQIEILKIIDKNNIKYSQNNNGIFLNMKLLCDKSLKQINNYLDFIKINNN